MLKIKAAACLLFVIFMTGCASIPATDASVSTPAVSAALQVSEQASAPPEETAPAPTPAVEAEKPVNPIALLSEEDQKIVKEKFTYTATLPADKKILDGKAKDGFYAVKEPPTSYGHYPYVGLTIKDGQITEVVFFQYNPDTKSYKDENYGKEYGTQFGEDTFEKAQISVEGGKKYPVRLIETQNLSDVDAVSGATYNFDLFTMGVNDALRLAQK